MVVAGALAPQAFISNSEVIPQKEAEFPKYPQLQFVRAHASTSAAAISSCSFTGSDLLPSAAPSFESRTMRQFSERVFVPGLANENPMCVVPEGIGISAMDNAAYFPSMMDTGEIRFRGIGDLTLEAVRAPYEFMTGSMSSQYIDRVIDPSKPTTTELLYVDSFSNPEKARQDEYGFSDSEWSQIIMPSPGDNSVVDWKGKVEGELTKALERLNAKQIEETGRGFEIYLYPTDQLYMQPNDIGPRTTIGTLCTEKPQPVYSFYIDKPVIDFSPGKISAFMHLNVSQNTMVNCPELAMYRYVKIGTLLRGLGNAALRNAVADEVERQTREYPAVTLPTIGRDVHGLPEIRQREVGIGVVVIGGAILFYSAMHDTGFNAVFGLRQ